MPGGKNARIEIVADPISAVTDADIVYTDRWDVSGQSPDAEVDRELFTRYQVNQELLAGVKPGALVLHGGTEPIGEEIAGDVRRAARIVLLDQQENRLHLQKALLLLILGLDPDTIRTRP